LINFKDLKERGSKWITKNSDQFKRYLNWAGTGLGILGILFVVLKLKQYGGQIAYSRLTIFSWVGLLALVLFYGFISILLLPAAWRNLLNHFGVSTSKLWCIRIFGLSQLAKYVPGSIFHLAGRQVMGVSAGLPGWPLAKSTLWDLLLTAMTGAFFGILIIPFYIPKFSIWYATGLFVLAIAVFMWMAAHWFSRWVAYAIGLYAIFLAFSGFIFVVILSLVTSTDSGVHLPIMGVCGAFVVAWLAGLLTPGAPAGAGIREIVLFTLLHSVVIQGDLLLAIILGRVVTVGGDFVFYCFSILMKKILSDIIPQQE
jgi:glycosyltransferase 2 family protein